MFLSGRCFRLKKLPGVTGGLSFSGGFMKIEELLSFRNVMYAFLGAAAGILALVVLEAADDLLPALFLSLVSFAAAVFVLVRLKKSFAPGAVLFFLLAVCAPLCSMDGFLEDLGEALSVICCGAGFITAAVSLFLLLVSFQKESGNT